MRGRGGGAVARKGGMEGVLFRMRKLPENRAVSCFSGVRPCHCVRNGKAPQRGAEGLRFERSEAGECDRASWLAVIYLLVSASA
ncbi:hypothetical protein EDF84_11177 [Erwinia rhapontici]|nr:hypothetical protein EDF84_11177 [Erwinia rhapontici]